MKIKGLKPTFVPSVPRSLENKLEFRTTTTLKEYDAKLFSYALMKLEDQILKEGLNINNIPRTFAIFTDDGNLEIAINESVLGINVHLITYAIKRWEKYNLNEVSKVAVFLEELCHWAWNIDDEVEVKHKIFDVLKRIYPSLKIEQVFSLESLK